MPCNFARLHAAQFDRLLLRGNLNSLAAGPDVDGEALAEQLFAGDEQA